MVLFGDITVGEMTVFINYALIIADPVQQLARTISNFISTQVNIERVSALLEREAAHQDTPEVIENTAPHSTRKEKTGSRFRVTSRLTT